MNMPLELFYWIQEYVDINTLLLTTSRLTAYRRQLYYWRLNRMGSEWYLDDPSRILQWLDASERQVRLKIDNPSMLTWYVSGCDMNASVFVRRCAHALTVLDSTDMTDVSALGHVHTLNVACCNDVTDVSALGHVHTLNVSYCKGVTDVSALGHVHKLNSSCCKGVKDVSALGHVHTLQV